MPITWAAWGLRLLPWAAGLLAAWGLLHVVNGWRKDAEQLPIVRQEYAVYRTDVETARRTRAEVSNEFQGELERLRGNQRPPAAPVRLCQQPPATVMPAGGSAGGRDGASAPGGQLPAGTGPSVEERPGPDIGTDLYAIADRADRLAAQLRACQSFVVKSQQPGE